LLIAISGQHRSVEGVAVTLMEKRHAAALEVPGEAADAIADRL
jgi:hypothetical protein